MIDGKGEKRREKSERVWFFANEEKLLSEVSEKKKKKTSILSTTIGWILTKSNQWLEWDVKKRRGNFLSKDDMCPAQACFING